MIKLPDKGRCTRKQFSKSFVVGNYVYLEFINGKTYKYRFYKSVNQRVLVPRPKILKIIEKNKLSLVYLKDEDEKWKTPVDLSDIDYISKQNIQVPFDKPINYIYNVHNIWSWFQRDEIRNIRVMNREELLMEYIMELL